MNLRTSLPSVTIGLVGLVASVAPRIASAQESAALFDAAVVELDSHHRFSELVDLDGDGRQDAIGEWPSPTTLSALDVTAWINDGSKLVPAWTLPVPGYVPPMSTIAARGRIDGDQRCDFAVAVGATLSVYTSNGAALPTLLATWTESAAVSRIVIADFDSDGLGDLALLVGETILLYRNAGNGTFPLAATRALTPNTGLTWMSSADVNGDATPDLVIVVNDDVLFTIPIVGCTFAPGTQFYPTDLSTQMVASGDIDNDGDADLVSFGSEGSYFVLRRVGPTAFVQEPKQTGGPGDRLVDVDGDGDLDAIRCGTSTSATMLGSTNVTPTSFLVAINDGTGAFAPAFALPGLGSFRLAGAADLDADGDVDLVGGRAVYYGNGPLRAPQIVPLVLPSIYAPSPRTTFDLDDDGDVDLMYLDPLASPLGARFDNSGDGRFTSKQVVAPAPPAGSTFDGPGFPGDFDGDGDIDLIVRHSLPGNVTVSMRLLKNGGGGEFTDGGACGPPGVSFGYWMTPDAAVSGDLDHDGDVDLVADQHVFWNDGTPFFTVGLSLDGIANEIADLNGDGLVDLVGQGQFWLGLGSHQFLYPIPFPVIVSQTGRHALADFDADGDLDYLDIDFSGQFNNASVLCVNDGAGNFTATNPFAGLGDPEGGGTAFRRVFAIDVNGDGLLDVVRFPSADGGLATSFVNLRKADNSGYLPPIQLALEAQTVFDADGDGDDDLFGRGRVFSNRRLEQPAAGLRRQYGVSTAGTGGMKPVLGARGPFRANLPAQLRLRGARGGTNGVMIVGLAESNIVGKPIPGAAIYTFPPAIVVALPVGGVAGAAGDGELTFDYVVPPSAAGFSFFHQMFVADPGAPFGATATNGLELHYEP